MSCHASDIAAVGTNFDVFNYEAVYTLNIASTVSRMVIESTYINESNY